MSLSNRLLFLFHRMSSPSPHAPSYAHEQSTRRQTQGPPFDHHRAESFAASSMSEALGEVKPNHSRRAPVGFKPMHPLSHVSTRPKSLCPQISLSLPHSSIYCVLTLPHSSITIHNQETLQTFDTLVLVLIISSKPCHL